MNASFDFTKSINDLQSHGQSLFHPNFKIYPEDYEIIFRLLVYFFKDTANAAKYNISFRKGILLTGPVGCGKTSIMTLLKSAFPKQIRYVVKSCRDINFEFIQKGYSVIEKYSTSSYIEPDVPRTYCFDDLGTENNLKYYGNDCNAMAEILLSRYDQFISKKMLTHLTTYLTSSEIDNIYGLRVRSRLREMFNLIAFSSDSKDKRS
jgi:energy-coupling factor transporter ATP-binding protein EcfA2